MKPKNDDIQIELALRTRMLNTVNNDISSVIFRVNNHLKLIDDKSSISSEAKLQFVRDYAFLRDIHLVKSQVVELNKLGVSTQQLRECAKIVERFEGRKIEGNLGAGLFNVNKTQRYSTQDLTNLFKQLAMANQQDTPSPRKS
jgi:hypothetical protein